MNNKRRKKIIYWLIGVGCGILLSGILGTFMSLMIMNNSIKARKHSDIDENTRVQSEVEMELVLKAVEEHALDKESRENEKIKEKMKEELIILIPEKWGATDICEILEKKGIIADANTLREYIKEQDKLTSLRHGEFKFPKNISDEEALNILLRKK